ncbi:PH domain-containing protein [Bacillus sp. JJ722]|uniref:PH domain-containing protein n=1 Tax=Bacillus sp. JJ722 TaxID=3122973 RepID=UPI003000F9B6
MGFFDLKVVCGVCDSDVGLNRFKIKQSKAWICPTCLEKAGGMTKINVAKVTIEEIKAIIDEKNARHSDDPMSTAIGMYQFCIDNKFGSGFNEKWGIKHFGIIEKNLIKDEKVLMTFIGLHNYKSATKHDSNYAYAISNKRIMFAQKALTGEKFKAVAHEKINDITFETGLVFGVLTIDTPQEKFNIALDKVSAASINNNIHQVLDELKNSSSEPQLQVVQATTSAADELKKFKELLDMGVLTEEEFNAKKKQLLGL